MSNITYEIRQALTKGSAHTSESVARLIADAQDETERLTGAVKADKLILGDIAATDEDHAAAQQRLNASEILLERLSGAIPRLYELRDQISLRERDERQQARYDRLVKRRDVVGKQLAEFLESLPAVATALHEAVQLREEAQTFNVRPTPGTLVNPMDEMVSDYPFLAPLVTDAVLKRTRLVGSDGTVLFAPVDASVSTPPATLPGTSRERSDKLSNNLQHAKDMHIHITARLHDMRREAAMRSVSLEQVAAAQGVDNARLAHFQDIAAGKMIRAAEQALGLGEAPEQPANGPAGAL